jgi:hypothetical protein
MKPFVDTGFLLALLIEMKASRAAWQIAHRFTGALRLAHLQRWLVENRLLREQHNPAIGEPARTTAANALQNLQRYVDELIFRHVHVDYDIAVHLAGSWQRDLGAQTPPGLLLFWPAVAVADGATHFLSFDARPRKFARASGLKLLPATL